MCCARMHPLSGHALVHGGRGNWDPNGRPQTTEVQAFLGFPAQLLLAQTAVISGAAPVNVTLTLDENESKVNTLFSTGSFHFELRGRSGLHPPNFLRTTASS